MNQPSEEIKSKLDLVDVIRDYLALQPAGANFRAKCPFHREKTPSFIVSPERQIWHCFGCGKGGDIFSFIMEMEGIDFKDALRFLAPKAGVILRREDPKITSQRNRLLDICDLCRRHYHRVLLESTGAEAVREYLVERGLKEGDVEEWQIGYSPDSWDYIFNLLKKKGYTENEIFLAGMIVKRNNRPGFYDRFRGRIMFPINDINGNTVAFTARVSPDKEEMEKLGKYINSPQTPIYDKSKLLFGLDRAKMEIKKRNFAVIVEGQMDAITAHQYDYKNVVAASSTALTREHIQLLKRYSTNIYLAFDMDEAGAHAVDKGVKEAMAAEMDIRIVQLPQGKDPDECIKKDPDGWKRALDNAKGIMEYYFDKITAGLDLTKVEHKRRIAREFLPWTAKLGNKIEQDYWLKKLGEAIDVPEDLLRESLIKFMRSKTVSRQNRPEDTGGGDKNEQEKKSSREEKVSELLLALVLKFPALFEYLINHLQADQVVGDKNIGIYKNLIIYYNNINSTVTDNGFGITFDYSGFRQWFLDKENNGGREKKAESGLVSALDGLFLLVDREFDGINIEQAREEVIKIIIILKKHYLSNRMKEVEKLIARQEKAGRQDLVMELMAEFKSLADEMREINSGGLSD